MRKLKTYNSYKPSGIGWIPSIPENWEIVDTTRCFKFPKEIVGNDFENYKVLSLSVNGVIFRNVASGAGKQHSDMGTYQIIRPDSIVLCLFDMDVTPRIVGHSDKTGIITSAYVNIAPKENISSKYYYYYFLLQDFNKYLFSQGTGIRTTLTRSQFGALKIALPPFEEQTAIARFLDYNMAKINRFIRKKKQLIKLLNEQKAAIINQAVTKGLDPNVKMKDSGIEWLGEIPEHWEWTYLRRFCQVYSGGTPSRDNLSYWENGTIPWLASGEVNKRFIYEADIFITEEGFNNSSAKWIPKGSLVIALAGQGKTKGMVATIENSMTGNQSLAAVIPNKKILDYVFLSYYIESKYKLIRGFVGDLRDGLNLSHIKSIPIPILPLDEQIKIANFIKNEHSVINTTITKIEKEIALVEEYKTALIAEAVTGKIDVRGYEVPEISEEETYEEIEEEISITSEDAAEYENESDL